MEQIQCINCGKDLLIPKVLKGASVTCECGCLQMCLSVGTDVSNWRVMNPFSFEDQRHLNDQFKPLKDKRGEERCQ